MAGPYVKAEARKRKAWKGCQIGATSEPGTLLIRAPLAPRKRAAGSPKVKTLPARAAVSPDSIAVGTSSPSPPVAVAVRPEPPPRHVAAASAAVVAGIVGLVAILCSGWPGRTTGREVAAVAIAFLLGAVVMLRIRSVSELLGGKRGAGETRCDVSAFSP